MEMLLSNIYLNGHTLGFHPQTDNLWLMRMVNNYKYNTSMVKVWQKSGKLIIKWCLANIEKKGLLSIMPSHVKCV